ncbi:MAG TPA: nucleotidyltransferase domain-containing protein [Thermodesulfobacteriota bacterium]|nr:nucleotidyltransferase domain-containing protein [Thermodesulfobacteriota bacterium]
MVRRLPPWRVILFGSRARGDAGPDSDVDLLVVMPVPGSRVVGTIERPAAREGWVLYARR